MAFPHIQGTTSAATNVCAVTQKKAPQLSGADRPVGSNLDWYRRLFMLKFFQTYLGVRFLEFSSYADRNVATHIVMEARSRIGEAWDTSAWHEWCARIAKIADVDIGFALA